MNSEQIEDKIYHLDGKNIKPSVIKHDILEEMKSRAYDLAFQSLEKFSVEKDMSDYVKTKFDQEFSPTWQCVIGMIKF
jgi:dynein light chain LC8-type